MRVSVVLVNYRRAEDTITCLRALRDELDYPAELLQLICVDNGSGDGSAERIAAAVPRVRLVELPDNVGFAAGCNRGVVHADGQVVALLNNDARPHRDWARAAVGVLAADPTVGAVASKVLDWDGQTVDFAGGGLSWFGMGYSPHRGRRADWLNDRPADVLFATGAAMFVRAGLYRELGGFDERFFMFYEDVDLGWRLNLRGHRVRYEPASIAYHRHHASMAGAGEFRELYLLERNALMALYKNLEQPTLDRVLPAALALSVCRGAARGELHSASFELTERGADDEPAMDVSKAAVASVLAIDRFVELLPSLAASRAVEQAERVRSDAALRPLFGNTFEPLVGLPRYLQAHRTIGSAFGIDAALDRRRVLVITADAVSERMAGPAIRAWNIAAALCGEHDVRLVSTAHAVATGAPFPVQVAREHELRPHTDWADVVVLQGWVLEQAPWLKTDADTVLVCDLYDPMHFEVLAQPDGDPAARTRRVAATVAALSAQLRRGDFFMCASHRQRDLWLGHLSALGRVGAAPLLAVAPFGLPSQPAVRSGSGPRELVPGIGERDKLVLWAGGVYDWFDPLTLVAAIDRLRERHHDVRLLFMGMHHPHPEIPEAPIAHRLRASSDELGLTGKHVFFNETWVPYDERQNWLLAADCGVTTHFDHVETTFAFRTRVLDYLWTGLPIVTTDGDAFADLVRAEALGVVVPPEDPGALAEALERVLYDDGFAAACRHRIAAVRARYTWSEALAPLVEFCRDARPAADRQLDAPRRTPLAMRLRRDAALAREYLTAGGPAELARRATGRLRRHLSNRLR